MKNIRNILAFAVCALAALAIASPAFAQAISPLVQLLPQHADLALMGIGMTTLAADVARTYELGERNHIPVIAADIIYEGAAVGDNGSGYARPLVAGDPFRGFCKYRADNSIGAAGAVKVEVVHEGRIELAISGLAITDVGKPVYASDDNVFTLTATGNSYIGRVIRWVSTGVGIVDFCAAKGELGSFTALTDNTTGTASDTLASISDAATKNAVASLAAKINQIQKYLA